MSVTNDQILQRIDEMIAEIVALPQRITVSGGQVQVHVGLSDISVNLGVVTAGEFRAGNGRDPGKGFTGVRIAYPGMTYSSSDWHIVGINNDTLQFGLRATDGVAVAGGGVVTLQSTGISVLLTTTFTTTNAYRFLHPSGSPPVSFVDGYYDAVTLNRNVVRLYANASGIENRVEIRASQVSGFDARVEITSGFSTISVMDFNSASAHETIQVTTDKFLITPNVLTSKGPVPGFDFAPGAHTNLNASSELHDVYFNISRTVQWATGALSNQRFVRVNAPTVSFVGASTITNAATVYIEGAPVAGTNATITNNYALWIDAGVVRFDGDLRLVGASIRESTALGARVYNNAAFTHNSTGNWLTLTFNSERFDNDTIHDTGSNTSRLTAITAGVYVITGHVEWVQNSTGQRGIAIRLNGSTFLAVDFRDASAAVAHDQSICTIYNLAANDYVELQIWQNSGGNLNVNSAANYSPEFSMTRIA